ncbi:Stf0 family sulfotransferase [Alteromonas macleodii]|uniref:Stf0 sulfotransferase n=1 Tax=Alteromonas macleodii (strain English Channel 673) TaxID=1004788 RepID=A0AB32ZXH7_ALTME|nr:Stf0 family sulfotransferase [Alteromonas macleodii]AFT74189.1 Stf0 sulfotransferase [Alteromonas macleodii str. 'English Channel 673']MBL3810107.1 Stf0 sulfotransferase [Alteromonas macleodii]MBL3883644.1 Stf0 sulfotransferase [Alteromonas macleodii]|tara:strand:+ start:2056 stop:2865 length:810 start_codon:yes stop_codon:yes gene_type:complete
MEQHLYEEQFNEIYDFRECTSVKKTLVIASTPRSGSHFLGHALHQTNHFGFPLEYANPTNLARWEEVLNVKGVKNVLNTLKTKRTSSNGVFSIKAHFSHLQQFGGLREFAQLLGNPYFVMLTRRDILSQAISLSIARQTGVWISGQQAMSENIKYDEKDICFCLKRTILHNASWKYLLASTGVRYIEITFEEARAKLPHTVCAIADFMDIDLPLETATLSPVTKKQSNSINEEFKEKFLQSKQSEMLLDVDLALGLKSKKKQLKELLFS